MTIYLASPFEQQAAMRGLRLLLQQRGYRVQARWLDEPEIAGATGAGDQVYRSHAQRDLEDLDASDVVVVNNPPDYYARGTGGRHVELGYALARRCPVILYGLPSNVFHTLPDVISAPTISSLLVALAQLTKE